MKRKASRSASSLGCFVRTRNRALRLSGIIALALGAACADAPESDHDASLAPSSTGGATSTSGNGNGNNAGSNGGGSDAGSSSSAGNNGSSSGKDAGSSNNGSSSGGLDGGARSDASAPSGGSGCLLKPNKDGWIDVASNGAHVQGSVFTYQSAGSTITPLTSTTTPFSNAGDGKLCVKGSGAKVLNMDYAMYYGAGMAFDLCQASASASSKYTLGQCPLGNGLGGIRFKLSGTTIPSELRVSFHEANRDQSTYVLAKAGANEALFKDGKVVYDMTAPQVNVANIDSVHFIIPTNDLAAVPFDFCIEQIELVMAEGSCADGSSQTGDAGSSANMDAGSSKDAGSSTDAGGSSTDAGGSSSTNCSKSGAFSTSDKFGSRNYNKYTVRNNFWNQGTSGAGTQTLWANSERCWGVDSNHSDSAPKGTVKGYPDVQRGWGVGAAGFPNSQHGLAIQVSQLTKAKIRWSMQAPSSGRTWALWDIYFHENANPGSGLAPVNLMIQQRIVDSDGWMQQDSAGWPKVTIAGITFREKRETSTVSSTRNRIQLYIDNASGNVLGLDDMKLDLKAVIDHYVQENLIRSSDYLTSIQAGFEIVSGGTYQTNEFWTAVQSEPDGP
jgi:hypothetical protein